jgi:hypothetical protein
MTQIYVLLIYFLVVFTSISCDNRKIVHSGFNNLVVGIQSLILYDDKTFYIELGLSGVDGTYQIMGNAIKLKYYDKPNTNFPDVMLIRKGYFISLDSLDTKKRVKIRRDR